MDTAIFINHMYLLLSAVYTRRFLYLSYSFVASLCLIITIIDDCILVVVPMSCHCHSAILNQLVQNRLRECTKLLRKLEIDFRSEGYTTSGTLAIATVS